MQNFVLIFIMKKGVFFVTRLKRNAVFKLLERRLVNRKTGVTSDHTIEVSSGGLVAEYLNLGDDVSYADAKEITDYVMNAYQEEAFDEVYVVYAKFRRQIGRASCRARV